MVVRDVMVTDFLVVPAHWPARQALDLLWGAPARWAVIRRHAGQATLYYLLPADALRAGLASADPGQPVAEVLDLHETGRSATADAALSAFEAPTEPLVVLDGGRPVGVLNVPDWAEAAAEPGGLAEPPSPLPLPPSPVPLPPSPVPPPAPPSPPAVDRGGPSAPSTSTAFNAYPRLDAPVSVVPVEYFDVTVGFRAHADQDLTQVTPIAIANPTPNATVTVCLATQGADVIDPATDAVVAPTQLFRPLPLRLDAAVVYTCRARPDAAEVRLSVVYLYENQPIGSAVRSVDVAVAARLGATGPAAALATDAAAAAPGANPCRMGSPAAASAVDMTVVVCRGNDDTLQWTISAAGLGQPVAAETQVADTRAFAAELQAKVVRRNPVLASQSLKAIGQHIADAAPPALFEAMMAAARERGGPPRLLWVTDEHYVPWELALLDDAHRPDPAAPPFLGAQAEMGRWVLHDRVTFPPPVEVIVQRVSAIAAEYDPYISTRPALPEAVAERAWLVTALGAIPLQATEDELLTVIAGPVQPGHLLHFALHGYSAPAANDQHIVLADDTELSATDMVSGYRCGQEPRYAAVFFNACQVGTAGSSLGQAAGFPGEFIRNGARAFIAPLWNVDDGPARELAQAFYAAVLDGPATVGEALRARRRAWQDGATLTPLAYIYYGHPSLRWRRGATQGG